MHCDKIIFDNFDVVIQNFLKNIKKIWKSLLIYFEIYVQKV